MSSTLIVDVCDVKEVYAHPNADALEFIKLKGWPVIVQKSIGLKVGDLVCYFPPDSVMSEELANRLEILKYLAPVKGDIEGTIKGYRVRAARLRGEPSYGTIDHIVPEGFKLGDDLKEYFGITKYEPPLKATDGDAETPKATFVKYTDIENIRNFPDILKEGEEVVFTEKLHGKNCRVGLLQDTNDEGHAAYAWMAGSHDVRRKAVDSKDKPSDFWLPLKDENMKSLLVDLSEGHKDVIVFCELIGSGVQDMAYGFQNGAKGYRAFDIYVAGHYLPVAAKLALFEQYTIPSVPILYRGPFSWSVMEEYTYGNTTMCEPDKAGKFKGREGIVITPAVERRDYALSGESKRVIFKSISADYIARKGGTEDH
jgi:RNA ligase (TIGR02306 family)